VAPAAAFTPSAFADIPIPPGYLPTTTGDHLAVAIGGSRRYLATYYLIDSEAHHTPDLDPSRRMRTPA
jgi:hypothetical protein